MPQISAFYGIVVYMYWSDHPPPHFHALYASLEATIAIQGGEVLKGAVPQRAYRLLREWARLHQPELLDNWTRCETKQPLAAIAPLP
ncbi:MAG: DUF4160 domain-containing protein [Actinomycetota bacterium]